MSTDAENTLANACTEDMHKRDVLAKHCGMVPESFGPGEAKISMTIKDFMLNGHGTCHGGMIFSMADTAFAHACNNENQVNVAMDCRIDFLYPAYAGDELVASARKTHSGRKSSLIEVVVVNQNGRKIAIFQGRSYAINKSVIEQEND